MINILDDVMCPQCKGLRVLRMPGGMRKNCDICKATGWVKREDEDSESEELESILGAALPELVASDYEVEQKDISSKSPSQLIKERRKKK